MFWYTKDLTHPIRNKLNTNKFNDILNSYYQKIDNFVGEILKSDKNLTLIIISDHGFSTYTRSVHLNTWLLNNGFLKLKNDMTVNPLHANVDWSKTVAYAGGFGGIYINTLGREKYGIVNKSDAEKLSTEIARKLKTLKDKKYNRGVFNKIYLKKEIYQGEFTNFAPDLTTGTNPGYRISWQTALGSGEKVIIEDNLKHWCGDHLIDPHFVPGVFFSNKKIVEKNPSVYDIAPTVLNFFSLPKTKEMSGKILF
jgi:predicted AlkP superfamily phosphohydrolase/phosphomutase